MRYYFLSIIFAVAIVVILFFNNYYSQKNKIITNEMRKMHKEEKLIMGLRTKYYELKEFVENNNVIPLSKEIAYEKTLVVLEKLRKKYLIEIVQESNKNQYYNIKFNFNEKFKNKKRLIEFFDTLYNKNSFFIPFIESFEYKTTQRGTQIKSFISISVPYME